MTEVTTLRPGWRTKMIVFIGAFLGFGAWGLYDATVAYPARGLKIASIREMEYLQAAQEVRGRLDPTELSVPDPKDQIDLLRRSRDRLGKLDKARLEWLESLEKAWRLHASRTTYDNSARAPAQVLKDLDARWRGQTSLPKAVDAFDIVVQWMIFFGCMVLGLGALMLLVTVWRRPFRFDPDTRTLTLPKVTAVDSLLRGALNVIRLPWTVVRSVMGVAFKAKSGGRVNLHKFRVPAPGGQTINPGDLAEVDKTHWSRYWVILRIKEGHPALGGRGVAIDLYRRAKVEGWVLEMEKAAFPEDASPSAAAG
ncbi:MAG: hypothetical protein IT439_10085 [Phycisphaerales bacterium]|nr:hypothetical protein [Phycisphaerales bacterium]